MFWFSNNRRLLLRPVVVGLAIQLTISIFSITRLLLNLFGCRVMCCCSCCCCCSATKLLISLITTSLVVCCCVLKSAVCLVVWRMCYIRSIIGVVEIRLPVLSWKIVGNSLRWTRTCSCCWIIVSILKNTVRLLLLGLGLPMEIASSTTMVRVSVVAGSCFMVLLLSTGCCWVLSGCVGLGWWVGLTVWGYTCHGIGGVSTCWTVGFCLSRVFTGVGRLVATTCIIVGITMMVTCSTVGRYLSMMTVLISMMRSTMRTTIIIMSPSHSSPTSTYGWIASVIFIPRSNSRPCGIITIQMIRISSGTKSWRRISVAWLLNLVTIWLLVMVIWGWLSTTSIIIIVIAAVVRCIWLILTISLVVKSAFVSVVIVFTRCILLMMFSWPTIMMVIVVVIRLVRSIVTRLSSMITLVTTHTTTIIVLVSLRIVYRIILVVVPAMLIIIIIIIIVVPWVVVGSISTIIKIVASLLNILKMFYKKTKTYSFTMNIFCLLRSLPNHW